MSQRLKTMKQDVSKLLGEPALVVAIILLFGVLGLFILLPAFRLLGECFMRDGRLTLSVVAAVVTKSYNYVPFLHSLSLGFWVAVIGTFVGYVFAYSVTRIRMPGQGFFRVAATFPIISPPFVVAMAAILMLGRNGWVTNALLNAHINIYGLGFELYGLVGMTLVETLSYFPTAFLLLLGVLKAIDPAMEEAAMDLGASRWRVFWTVTLPLSLPGIAAAMLLLFIESLADFGTPMILSGRYNVLPTQAYLLITGALQDRTGGSLLAFLLLIPSLIAFLLQKYWLERKSFVTVTGKPVGGAIKEVSPATKAAFFSACMFFVGLIFLLYGMVVFGSFTKQWGADHTFTTANYVNLFTAGSDYVRAIWTSLKLAALATPVCGLLGMLTAYLVVRRRFPGRGLMEFVSMLTFAMPGTVVGIGYLLAFNEPPLALKGTAFLMVMLFTFRNMPVGIRAGVASLNQIDPSLEEASQDMGATASQTFFKITLPLIAPAFFTGLAYCFVKCMSAISAVIFLTTGDLPLITVSILDAVAGSDYSTAAALSIVLILFVLCALGVIQGLVSMMERAGMSAQKATGG